MDPKPEKNANLQQPPEQCTGAGGYRVPAGNAAEQPSGDDGLPRSDLAANRPDFARLAKLMVEAHAEAEAAEKQAAIARGEPVAGFDGWVAVRQQASFRAPHEPVRPANVKLISQTRGIVFSLAVYPDQERLVSYDASGSIQVWDLRSGQELCRRENVPNPIDQLAVSPDGSRVMGIDRFGSVFAWDAQTLTPIVDAANLDRYAALLGRATKVCGRGTAKVVTMSGVEIYQDGGKVCARWPNREPVVLLLDEGEPDDIQLAVSDDGLYTAVMVTHGPDSVISVFETEHLLRAPEWADPGDPCSEAIDSWHRELIIDLVDEMLFSPDGKALAVRWSEGSGVTIWDLREQDFDTYGTYTRATITAFAFLGNKKVVVGRVGRDNEIEVLDLELHTP
jgi:WD40 repeat protein